MIKNVVWSLLSYGSSLIIAFFLSPFILGQLGDARYGIWALFGEMLSYYGLLDLGVRGALSYYAGKSLAVEDKREINEYFNTAMFSLAAISTTAFAVSMGLITTFSDQFVDSTVTRGEMISAAGFLLFIFCLGMPLEVFGGLLVGNRRQYMVNSSEIGARLLSTTLMFISLSLYPSLIAVACTQLAGKLTYWSLLIRATRKHLPFVEISLHHFCWNHVRALVRYGGQNAIGNLSWILITRKDALLISMFWGASTVPFYSFARILVSKITMACSSVTQPLRPGMVHEWARGNCEEALKIYYKGARYSAFAAAMLVAFIAGYGSDFIRLWIGERFVSGSWMLRTDIALWILLVGSLPRLMHSISWQLLYATNKQKGLTVLLISEAVVNMVMSLVLVRRYGVVGLAISTSLPMLLSHTVGMAFLLKRAVGVSLRRYVVDGVGRPLATAAIVFTTGLALRHVYPVTNWKMFFGQGILLALLAVVLGIIFVITPGERKSVTDRMRMRARAMAHLASSLI